MAFTLLVPTEDQNRSFYTYLCTFRAYRGEQKGMQIFLFVSVHIGQHRARCILHLEMRDCGPPNARNVKSMSRPIDSAKCKAILHNLLWAAASANRAIPAVPNSRGARVVPHISGCKLFDP